MGGIKTQNSPSFEANSVNDYVLKRALEDRKPIQIIYEDKNGKITQRTVTLHRMNQHNILVWCHLKKNIRTLKMENVLSVGIINKYQSA